ncbi:MAG: twin-arginine translocation signal domain-containing protein [Trueperaceae bacterium]|nr:twin-arginine translocation signal domain-containing protein [Trueperaceae bacterium]
MAYHKLEESLDKVFQAKLDRRQFMRRLGVAATAAAALPHIGQYAFAQDSVMPSSIIAGKVDGLIVHNDRAGVLETPLELLREARVTPPNTPLRA